MPSDSSHLQPGAGNPVGQGIRVGNGRDAYRPHAQAGHLGGEIGQALGRRVGDELGNEPRLTGDHLHQQRVAVDGVEVLRKRRVDEGALDAALVHGVEKPFSSVRNDAPVVSPAKGHVRVEYGHAWPEIQIYITHALSVSAGQDPYKSGPVQGRVVLCARDDS